MSIKKFNKSIKVKPSFYSYCFYNMKDIALKYGYNLVLHGSLNRDLDLIAIPWQIKLGNIDIMIDDFAKYLGGEVIPQTDIQKKLFSTW